MSDWRIFQGSRSPHDGIDRLPDPPNWRRFRRARVTTDGAGASTQITKEEQLGKTFQTQPDQIDMVNAAPYLRRPLLVTGKPGTGKSSLAYAVAYELDLGPVLLWPITTRSTLQNGLYRYDAIGRLQDPQRQNNPDEIGRYVQLGPLGTALLPSAQPRVLLIDEIDKSDIDLPNDLLHVFEEGEFEIPELARLPKEFQSIKVRTHDGGEAVIERGRVRCDAFPFVVLTSNGEREFPPAFLRRCLRLTMIDPGKLELERIVRAHLGGEIADEAGLLIDKFLQRRSSGDLATDQLLNTIYLLTREVSPVGPDQEKLIDVLLAHLTNAEAS